LTPAHERRLKKAKENDDNEIREEETMFRL
jgi:hypothetical protein